MSDEVQGSAASVETAAPVEAPQTVDAALDSFSAQLLKDEESSTPETQETPAVSEGEAPTTEAPPQDAADSDASKQGPIPFAVHKTALENARTKAAEETQQRLLQEWRSQVEPVLPHLNAITQDAQNGTIDGLTSLIAAYAENPQLGPQVRSLFGRMLSQQRQQQAQPQAPTDTRPEPDLQTADGALVYSAERAQQLMAWEKRQLLAEVQQQMKPLQEMRQQQETQVRIAQQRDAALQWATSQLQEFRADPDFKAHEAVVKERMAANPSWSLDRAWQQVYRDVVVPKKLAQGNVQYLEAAAKKSRGSAPDPVASAPVQQKRGRTVDEELDRVFDSLAR
jgi:hypothetical protein